MNILYIRSSNIYDDSRATKEIQSLVSNGHAVHVLGWNRDGVAEERTSETFSEYGCHVSFSFFPCSVDGGIGLNNIDKLLKWMLWTKKQLRMLEDIDAIHICNLDSALGVFRLAKRKGLMTVYDIYDYYIDSHSIPRVAENFIERLEINVINKSDVTVICTEERKEQIAKANPSKVVVIHNSPSVPVMTKVEEKYDYSYCGSLFDKRLIGEIFDAYPYYSAVRMAFAGYGQYKDSATKLSQQFDNFSFLGAVSYDEVLVIESQTKVISALYEPSIRNHRLCAPNKFYEALALGKPVVVCRGTGIDKIVEANNIGVVIDYDAGQFFETVNYLINNPKIRIEMGNRARKLYESQYKWEIMEQRLLSIYC